MRNVVKLLAAVLVLMSFLLSLSRLEKGRQAGGAAQLEEAVRRAAVACYAAEGFYPPDVDDLCSRYGIQYEQNRYQIHYDCFASNLMPDITVVEK